MKRDPSLEWLRVLGALFIVWFHADVTGSYWGYSGLIVFLLLSMMFEAGPNLDRKVSTQQRALRLLVPWAFWWVVYGALNLVRHHPVIDLSHGLVLGILASPSIHLWYLPFVFIALSLFGLIKGRVPVPFLAVGAALAAGLLIWGIPIWRPASLAAGFPLAQWAHACAPVALGILIGTAMRLRWLWTLAAPLITLLVWACFRPFPDVAPIYLVGLGLVVAVLAIPYAARGSTPNFKRLFASMLGVYLVHPIALAILHPVTDRFEPFGVVLAFAFSTAGVLFAQWIAPWPSSLLLGTSMPKDQPKTLFRKRP